MVKYLQPPTLLVKCFSPKEDYTELCLLIKLSKHLTFEAGLVITERMCKEIFALKRIENES